MGKAELEKSAATEKQPKVEAPKYTKEEIEHIGALMVRLSSAQIERDKNHPEFNQRTYIQQYEENERIANSHIKGKKFEGDINISTGTVEQKLSAVLAELNRLKLAPEVLAFDKNNNELVGLGLALTDTIHKTEEQEEDPEKKLIRQLELLKQGHVFVQEQWAREFKKDKKFNKKEIGKVRGVDWTEKLVKVFEGPRRQVLYGPGVFLGNIREPDMKKQQYIFTHKLTSWEEAKSRYGMTDADDNNVWDRWENVTRERIMSLQGESRSMESRVNDAWALTQVDSNMVEEIHYQDRFNNEFQIFLNGVAMLPIGFPLSAISPGGEYNIEKQILYYNNPFWAYGRSFVMRVREQSDILDEMLRLLIIKTRKSIHPPYVNISGRVISSRVLMPGRITMGISGDSLQPIGTEGQGATASEYEMFKLLQDNIDKNTVSQQFTGQPGRAGTTATEVQTLQAQAQKALSLILFAAMLLETKIAYLRLFNLLENYFDPIDTRFNEAKDQIVDIFRNVSRKTNIEGVGEGIREIIPTTKLPTSREVQELELFEGTVKTKNGRPRTRQQSGLLPKQKIFINPKELRKARTVWFIDVDVRPKETRTTDKLMLREQLVDILTLMQLGSTPNVKELEQMHALVWDRPKSKIFKEGQATSPLANAVQRGGGAEELPTPDQLAGRSNQPGVGAALAEVG